MHFPTCLSIDWAFPLHFPRSDGRKRNWFRISHWVYDGNRLSIPNTKTKIVLSAAWSLLTARWLLFRGLKILLLQGRLQMGEVEVDEDDEWVRTSRANHKSMWQRFRVLRVKRQKVSLNRRPIAFTCWGGGGLGSHPTPVTGYGNRRSRKTHNGSPGWPSALLEISYFTDELQ